MASRHTDESKSLESKGGEHVPSSVFGTVTSLNVSTDVSVAIKSRSPDNLFIENLTNFFDTRFNNEFVNEIKYLFNTKSIEDAEITIFNNAMLYCKTFYSIECKAVERILKDAPLNYRKIERNEDNCDGDVPKVPDAPEEPPPLNLPGMSTESKQINVDNSGNSDDVRLLPSSEAIISDFSIIEKKKKDIREELKMPDPQSEEHYEEAIKTKIDKPTNVTIDQMNEWVKDEETIASIQNRIRNELNRLKKPDEYLDAYKLWAQNNHDRYFKIRECENMAKVIGSWSIAASFLEVFTFEYRKKLIIDRNILKMNNWTIVQRLSYFLMMAKTEIEIMFFLKICFANGDPDDTRYPYGFGALLNALVDRYKAAACHDDANLFFQLFTDITFDANNYFDSKEYAREHKDTIAFNNESECNEYRKLKFSEIQKDIGNLLQKHPVLVVKLSEYNNHSCFIIVEKNKEVYCEAVLETVAGKDTKIFALHTLCDSKKVAKEIKKSKSLDLSKISSTLQSNLLQYKSPIMTKKGLKPYTYVFSWMVLPALSIDTIRDKINNRMSYRLDILSTGLFAGAQKMFSSTESYGGYENDKTLFDAHSKLFLYFPYVRNSEQLFLLNKGMQPINISDKNDSFKNATFIKWNFLVAQINDITQVLREKSGLTGTVYSMKPANVVFSGSINYRNQEAEVKVKAEAKQSQILEFVFEGDDDFSTQIKKKCPTLAPYIRKKCNINTNVAVIGVGQYQIISDTFDTMANSIDQNNRILKIETVVSGETVEKEIAYNVIINSYQTELRENIDPSPISSMRLRDVYNSGIKYEVIYDNFENFVNKGRKIVLKAKSFL